ncbi:MAG TPA: hypothetical protein VFY40_14885 [Blastocatellia bacterium]|nr:hypothetical protein [Blastocatellia bacterium]
MTQRSFPRYFIGRSDALSQDDSPVELLPPEHVIDSFFIGGRHLLERELAVAVDCLGNLRALTLDDLDMFPAAARTELAYHDMSGAGQRRLLETAEFFLFRLELLEQPAGTPGWNDPVYLYGTLYGPWPSTDPKHAAGIEGQLTITRGDLLDGLVRGTGHAFRYAGSGGARDARLFHMLLPGAREDEIRRGSGIVLAYPLLPAELTLTDVSNELVVGQLLYDILVALKEDLEREQIVHPLRSIVLPVPSREALERQLMSQGYEIKGGAAVKKVESGGGFQGVLATVFGPLMSDRLELPPEGKADDFLDLAVTTLNTLTGWPSPRIAALRSCVRPVPEDAYRNALTRRFTPTPQVRTPQPSAIQLSQQAPQARQVRPVRPANEPRDLTDWMQDFITSHREPGAPPPRLTSTSAMNRTPMGQEREWMKDFASQAADKHRKPDKSDSRMKPEWLDDFE